MDIYLPDLDSILLLVSVQEKSFDGLHPNDSASHCNSHNAKGYLVEDQKNDQSDLRVRWLTSPIHAQLTFIIRSKSARQLIYTTNFICIIWTMISVELTLLWNGISGVYTLNSTGQLIPFIIGVVGLLSLLHGISVERSKLKSTDVLLVSLGKPRH